MRLSLATIQRIAEQQNWEYAHEYGEPGYSTNKSVIVFGNYNGFGHKRVLDAIEESCKLEWSDEWIIDYDSRKAYRTSPDSYGWQSSILWTDGDFLTPDDGVDTWVEEIKNDPHKALTHFTAADLVELGYTRWPDPDQYFENGFHPGQTDDPTEITALIRAEHGDTVDVVFLIDDVGQFDMRFGAYVRPVDTDD